VTKDKSLRALLICADQCAPKGESQNMCFLQSKWFFLYKDGIGLVNIDVAKMESFDGIVEGVENEGF